MHAAGTEQRRAFYRPHPRHWQFPVGHHFFADLRGGGFSRAGYYRSLRPAPARSADDLDLRDAVARIALEWPAYGTRRMKRKLKRRGGEHAPV